MRMPVNLMLAIGKAALNVAGAGLVADVAEIARAAWEDWKKSPEERIEELEAVDPGRRRGRSIARRRAGRRGGGRGRAGAGPSEAGDLPEAGSEPDPPVAAAPSRPHRPDDPSRAWSWTVPKT